MAKAGKKAGGTVTVTQVKSDIRRPEDQGATLRGLGLGKINRSSTLEDSPAVRGMIKKVAHLIKVSEAK